LFGGRFCVNIWDTASNNTAGLHCILLHSFKTRRDLLSTVQYGLVWGKITINGAQKYNSAHIDISGKEPIRITGLLFLGLQSLSGLALERISEKNPEDEEKGGG